MTNALTTRQAGLIVFVAMLCNKMLSLNSLIAYGALNDSWIVFLISFVIDFLFVLIFLYFMKKIDKPILVYIKERFGKVTSVTVAILFAILFLFRTTQIAVDIYLFFVQLIYVEINRVVFVICFLTIIFYFGTRKLRSLGRTAELVIFLIVISLGLSFVMSMKAIDFEKLLPIFSHNFLSLGREIVLHNLWFGDFLLFFYFVGNVKMEKNTPKRLIWSYVLSCAIILLFVVIFTSAFGNTASMHRVAVIDVTEFSPRLLAQGRYNWLVYFMFPIVLVLGLGIYSSYVTMSYKFCIRDSVKSKNTISGLLTTASVLALFFVFRFTYSAFYNFVVGGFFYYVLAIQYVLPILLLVMISIDSTITSKKSRYPLRQKASGISNSKMQSKQAQNKRVKHNKNVLGKSSKKNAEVQA